MGTISNSERTTIFSIYKAGIKIINLHPVFILEIVRNNLFYNTPEE